VWIAKCNDWREWKPIIFESNYLNAMASGSTHMHIKMVPSSWIGNEDEDYFEDLSVCFRDHLFLCSYLTSNRVLKDFTPSLKTLALLGSQIQRK
jgi:hypothetical protein